MGCDIHAFIEVKLKSTGEWTVYSKPKVRRDYRLFEKMAGVRGHVHFAIKKPQGLPDDISEVVRLEYEDWGEDAHTPSWLDLYDLQRLETWYEMGGDMECFAPFGYFRCNGFSEAYQELPKEYEDMRIVFWFDS